MSNKRITIGRTLNPTGTPTPPDSAAFSQHFTLNSGKRVHFQLEIIPATELESKSFVRQETNGRDQAALTKESLKDITRSIRLQQFFPAIGRRQGDKVEILDGSRRRAGALLCSVGLTVLVTDEEISTQDARQLASDIQTAKEHNLREVGMRLLYLRNNGMTQKEIAEAHMLSAARVTRAIQAASVPAILLTPFPVQSELTHPDYKFLLDIAEKVKYADDTLESLARQVVERKKNILLAEQLPSDELKNEIMAHYRHAFAEMTDKAAPVRITSQKLWRFDDKDKFARKKMKGRMFSYEFNRLPKELEEELDQKVYDIIRKHLSRSN